MFNQKKHSREETHTGLAADIKAPRPAVLSAIAGGITCRPTAPVLGGAVVITGSTDSALQIEFTNKLASSWCAIITLEDRPDGCYLHFALSQWLEQGGVANGLKELRRLREEIMASVATLDPTVQFKQTYEMDKKQAKKAERLAHRADA